MLGWPCVRHVAASDDVAELAGARSTSVLVTLDLDKLISGLGFRPDIESRWLPAAGTQEQTDPVLRHAIRADLPTVTAVWVEAFAADPFFRWLAPEDADWTGFGTAWMGFVADLCFERGHTYLADNVAAAWVPPDLALVGPDEIQRGRDIIASHAGEAQADEALAAIIRARGHAMDEPHWTLQYIGVRDRARGEGLGTQAVAPMLAVVDRDGLPCGLTSTNARNLPFYERHGFRVVAEVPLGDGAAALRPMERR